ncbi:MAG: class I SAM-dependent methyltransferase [Cyanobacteria bacterium RUI128]|nr:class I SAM-dependent methyltransferase [Cyanobacteria bacterium RUI128]
MNNKSALQFYKQLANKPDNNPSSVKLAHNSDYTDIDAKFILKYLDNDKTVLDLGSGTGLIVNKISDKAKSIDCVEVFEEFSQFIEKKENVQIINTDIKSYNTDKKYDLILLFGIIQYFSKDEATDIYNKCYDYLKPNGRIIIKNQFGIKDDVIASGYSEEQKADYFSEYRHIDKETNMLKTAGFDNLEITDIYPAYANRWNNTHFYAITGIKPPCRKADYGSVKKHKTETNKH